MCTGRCGGVGYCEQVMCAFEQLSFELGLAVPVGSPINPQVGESAALSGIS